MWTIMSGWQMLVHSWVDSGGVWMMVVVVCGRCEKEEDGSRVCMVVGWWGGNLALVPVD